MIHVHTRPQAFTPEECRRLRLIAEGATPSDARLVGRARDHNLRRADLVWLDDLPEAGWAMDRIVTLVAEANREGFGFDLTEFAESPQIARYGAEREGHFDWHSDVGDGPLAGKRKLTMVVQLSEPGDYEGGTLEVMPSAQVIRAEKALGAACLFPSYLLHRVTPVTRGARQSLTVWAHGPAFR